MNIRKKILG